MGRHPEPQIAERLLDACTDVVLREGLPDRLQPFVEGTGASARKLLYHFGTRDDLLRAVLRRARERQLSTFGALLTARRHEDYTTTLASAWRSLTGADGQPYLRLFGRLRAGTEHHLWPGFEKIATTDWLEPLAEGLDSMGRRESATLVLAVIRGLLMDLDATADRERVDDAFDRFLSGLRAVEPIPGRGVPPSSRG
ncbi:MAG: hypothetical protein RI885_347 [Actinomycetota bacterium]|jgi:AcrR family transcriptional regulator